MADHAVVIVGATRGVGRAVAKCLTQQGKRIIVVGRDESKTARLFG